MNVVARDDIHDITVPESALPESALGVLVVDSDEVAFLANVIAQARLAIDDWEFSSLVGLEPQHAEALRDVLVTALRDYPNTD